MKKRAKFYLCGVLCAAVFVGPQVATAQGVDGRTAFDMLAQLAGEWEAQAHQGLVEGQAYGPQVTNPPPRVRYELLAQGTVVVATNVVPRGNDMFTVYRIVDNNLVATHHCVTGVATQMTLNSAASSGNQLVFDFFDVENLQDPQQLYMHSGTLTLSNSSMMQSQWRMVQGGEEFGVDTTVLNRVAIPVAERTRDDAPESQAAGSR